MYGSIASAIPVSYIAIYYAIFQKSRRYMRLIYVAHMQAHEAARGLGQGDQTRRGARIAYDAICIRHTYHLLYDMYGMIYCYTWHDTCIWHGVLICMA